MILEATEELADVDPDVPELLPVLIPNSIECPMRAFECVGSHRVIDLPFC